MMDGQASYYIRAVVNGIENGFATYGQYFVPNVNDIRFRYDYGEEYTRVEQAVIKNNNSYVDVTDRIKSHEQELYPFSGLKDKEDTLLLCFDKPFGKGPNSLLFVMEEDKIDHAEDEKMAISYLTEEKNLRTWKNTEFEDQTSGFTRTGHLVFGNINKMIKDKLFGIEGYWLKVQTKQKDSSLKVITRMIMNSVWAVQEEYIQSEGFNVLLNDQRVQLSQVPVLDQDVWVNEYSQISSEKIVELQASHDCRMEENVYNELEAFWVKWTHTKDLMNAKSDARVYTIDPISGLIQFGDNKNGMKVPRSNDHQVLVDYRFGGGLKGNVDVDQVSNLDHAIAFIDSVYNPLPSVGGCDHEAFEHAVDRCANGLRNLDRAVTIKDMESIAKAASRNVLKVKCIPNLNKDYKHMKGHVMVLVIPNQTQKERLSVQLKEQLYNHLADRCPGQMVKKLHVEDPIYVTISVYGRFVGKDQLAGRVVHDEIIKRIEAFIDIKNGNFNGEGWHIGKLPNEIMFHSVLNDIPSIDRILSLNLFYSYEDADGKHIIRSEALKDSKCMIVSDGEYKIDVDQRG